MQNDSAEEQIRKRAYELWQKDGSPSGQADKYWEEARASFEQELVAAATSPSVAETDSKKGGTRKSEETSKKR